MLKFIISVLILGGALGFAYTQGYLDSTIHMLKIYIFKAEAKAESAVLQAKGEDFVEDQLTGNKKAAEVQKATGIQGIENVKNVKLPGL